jgi:hypothetical protein
MGEPFAGFLFGGDGVEGGVQVIPYRRYGILGVEERDRVLQLATEVAQLEVTRKGVLPGQLLPGR